MKYNLDEYEQQINPTITPTLEFGCGYCWDKRRNKTKELFFLDNANNMRICTYCPSCGRLMEEAK